MVPDLIKRTTVCNFRARKSVLKLYLFQGHSCIFQHYDAKAHSARSITKAQLRKKKGRGPTDLNNRGYVKNFEGKMKLPPFCSTAEALVGRKGKRKKKNIQNI